MAASIRRLTGIARPLHGADGKTVEVTLLTDQGAINVQGTPQVMEDISSKLAQLAQHALNLEYEGKFLRVRAVHLTDVAAGTPIGQPLVDMSLRGENGTVSSFALTPDQASELRRQLEEAEGQARANAETQVQ